MWQNCLDTLFLMGNYTGGGEYRGTNCPHGDDMRELSGEEKSWDMIQEGTVPEPKTFSW